MTDRVTIDKWRAALIGVAAFVVVDLGTWGATHQWTAGLAAGSIVGTGSFVGWWFAAVRRP